jgi:hypothetical protein
VNTEVKNTPAMKLVITPSPRKSRTEAIIPLLESAPAMIIPAKI